MLSSLGFLICRTYCALNVYVGVDGSHYQNISTKDTAKLFINFVINDKFFLTRDLMKTILGFRLKCSRALDSAW